MRRTAGFAFGGALFLAAVSHAALIRGRVRDAGTGEAIPSCVVGLAGTELGDLTNSDGYFLIGSVPPGTYHLNFSALGYEELTRDVLILGDTAVSLDARLTPSPIRLKEVKVTAQRAEFRHSVNVSSLTITPAQLRQMPNAIETDLFRSLDDLPGVVTANDFSAVPFVRGGNADPQHTGRASE
jgi:hypothetical protein